MADTLDINRPKQNTKTQVRRAGKAKLALMLEATRGLDISKLAVDHLVDVLEFYARMCSADPSNMGQWMDKRAAVAARLAPYQSPTFQAISVTGNQQDQAKLAQMSDAELAMALKARAEDLGMEVKIRSKLEYRAKHFARTIDEEILNGPQREENEG